MRPPKLLLFDLGGVIVRWVGFEELAKLTNTSMDSAVHTFVSSEILSGYETGRSTDNEFIAEFRKLYGLTGTETGLKTLWCDWVQDCYPGTKFALKTLKKNFVTACLSNTNELHWKRLKDHILTEKYFNKSYASHLIKLAKPDLKIYRYVSADTRIAPEDIWFFDDTLINIEVARKFGMQAFHVDRKTGVIPILKNLKLL